VIYVATQRKRREMQQPIPNQASRPHYNPTRDEWQQRTGPSTWLVWQHGTRRGDEARLVAEMRAEAEREGASEA
jgi:hypothetical protein